MTVGIDLSPLEGPHRFRGIGSVLVHLINHLANVAEENDRFIFFISHNNKQDNNFLDQLNLQGLNYDIRYFNNSTKLRLRLPGRLALITSTINRIIKLYELRFGDSRLKYRQIKDLTSYLQIDPNMPLPKHLKNLKNVLFVHDLIPYVLEWDYLWNYYTARQHNFSRKSAIRVQVRRWLYFFEYHVSLRHANVILANSKHTRRDFIEYLAVSPQKIIVTSLGVDMPDDHYPKDTCPVASYKKTSWGNILMPNSIDNDIPFILFIGGADRRRKINHLVTAFNRLRAKNINLRLVLAGDTMQGPMSIGTEEIQYALRTSSYLDDIIFLGYVQPDILSWLYKNTRAYIFPSTYEGFGLPVLEALSYGTPVIAYNNLATKEIGGECISYVNNIFDLETTIQECITNNDLISNEQKEKRKEQALKFSWNATTRKVLSVLRE